MTLCYTYWQALRPGRTERVVFKGIRRDDAGVMSEAGMPGLADPGNIVVEEAHRRAYQGIPLTGPLR